MRSNEPVQIRLNFETHVVAIFGKMQVHQYSVMGLFKGIAVILISTYVY